VNGPGTVILIVRFVFARRNFNVLDFHGTHAPDGSDDPRHGRRPARSPESHAVILDVHALERGREAVGIALAANLAVGDDVEPRLFLRANRHQRRIALRLFEIRLRDAPDVLRADARHAAAELRAIDQPFGLRETADEGGGKQHAR
jgi:hypothetical protein